MFSPRASTGILLQSTSYLHVFVSKFGLGASVTDIVPNNDNSTVKGTRPQPRRRLRLCRNWYESVDRLRAKAWLTRLTRTLCFQQRGCGRGRHGQSHGQLVSHPHSARQKAVFIRVTT